MLRVGTGKVLLTAGDLARLGTVIRFELISANQIRFFARAIWLLIACALVWLLTSAITGPFFAYPWSN
jgi:thiosulfate reductase cytochrome b subunit